MRHDFFLADAAAMARARAEYRAFIAGLLAVQTATATAQAQVNHAVGRDIDRRPEHAIVALLEGRPGWRRAAVTLCGSFHPGVAPLIFDKVS